MNPDDFRTWDNLIMWIQDQKDITEEKIVFHDVNGSSDLVFHRGMIQGYEEVLKQLSKHVLGRSETLEV